MTPRSITARRVAPVLAPLLLLAACGSDDADLDLSPTAAEGRRIANSSGCASCHGADGGGGVGPAFAGLYGSDVELEDGTVIVADDAYLTESIREPGAKRVAGYSVMMPENQLTDDEIELVIAYISELEAAP